MSDEHWGSSPALSGEPLGPPAALPAAPATADRYAFARPVGTGGMGRVEAWDDRFLGRTFARKTLRTGLSANAATRLLREAHLTARLDHPGIVPVYDAGIGEDGLPWYAMRLIHGRSLAEARKGATDPMDLVRRVHAACEAVAYAHAHGIVHRDLTPWNIMVGPFGETLVVDWGLARDLAAADDGVPAHSVEPSWPSGSSPHLTQVGAVLGTPQWMSPEASRGDPIGRPADVYAIGRILAYILSPQADEAPDLTANVPPDLRAIIDKATRDAPDARYPDAGALAADLDAWLSGRRVAAHAYGLGELLRRFIRRWRAPLGVAVAAAALLAVTLVQGWRQTAAERDRALSAERRTADLLAATSAELALRALAEGDTAAARRHAAASLAAAPTPAGRGAMAAVAASRAPTLRSSWDLPDCPAPRRTPSGDAVCFGAGVAWYDQGATAPRWRRADLVGEAAQLHPGGPVVVLQDARLTRLDPATGATLSVIGRALPAHGLTTTPDGFDAAIVNQRDLVLIATAGDTWISCPPGEDALSVAVDGPRWWTPCSGGTLLAGVGREVVARTPMRDADGAPFGRTSAVTRLPDGRLLLGTLDAGLAVVDPATGAARHLATLGIQPIRRLAVDASGRVAATPSTGPIRLYDLRAEASAGTFPEEGSATWLDGDLLLTAPGRLARWDAPVDPVALPNDAGLADAAISAQGKVALADGNGQLTLFIDGARLRPAAWTRSTLKAAAWSPDEALVWAGGADTGSLRALTAPTWASIPTAYAEKLRTIAALHDGSALVGTWSPRVFRVRPHGALDVLAEGEATSLDASRDGTRALISSVEPWLRLYDARTGAVTLIADGPGAGRAAIAPGGGLIAGARDGAVDLWTPDGRPFAHVPTDVTVTAVAVEDGGAIWTGQEDGTVQRLLPDGALDLTARAHTGRISDIEVAPDGRVLTISWDRTARWWRPATNDPQIASPPAE